MSIDSISSSIKTASAVTEQDKKLKQACQDFEAIFTGFMLKGMRKTVEKNDLFGSSKEEEMFQDMIDTETCKAASQRSTMGIAEVLYRQLSNQANLMTATRGKDQ